MKNLFRGFLKEQNTPQDIQVIYFPPFIVSQIIYTFVLNIWESQKVRKRFSQE